MAGYLDSTPAADLRRQLPEPACEKFLAFDRRDERDKSLPAFAMPPTGPGRSSATDTAPPWRERGAAVRHPAPTVSAISSTGAGFFGPRTRM